MSENDLKPMHLGILPPQHPQVSKLANRFRHAQNSASTLLMEHTAVRILPSGRTLTFESLHCASVTSLVFGLYRGLEWIVSSKCDGSQKM